MNEAIAKGELMLGLLAVEMRLLPSDGFVSSLEEWADRPEGALSDVLLARQLITSHDRTALQHIVQRQIELCSGDVDQCMSALMLNSNVRDRLSRIDHPAVRAIHNDPSLIDTHPIGESAPADGDDTLGWSPRSATPHSPMRPGDARRFEHLRAHAKGGLGEVHVALDREFGREVAYKQIQTRFVNDIASRQRFQFEAEVTGQLEHPGVVPVYSAGKELDGAPYYAMRFVRGNSLAEEIKQHHARKTESSVHSGLGLRRLLTELINACNAIAFAHSRGVIHRDIKPQNIMVGDYGETFVVDWGMAKRLDQATESDPTGTTSIGASLTGTETMPGSIAGTPAFMSPEQAEGDLDRINRASDVYSLGATLYVILTGRAPFGPGTSLEILDSVREGGYIAPRQLDPMISAPLEAICLKAMSHEPGDRYTSAELLREDLERWLAREPVTAWPEPWTVRARRWTNRHRTLVLTSMVGLLVSAIGLATVSLVQLRANSRLEVANDNLTRTSAQLQTALTDVTQINARLNDANEQLLVANDRAIRRADLAVAAIEGIHQLIDDNVDVKNDPDLQSLRDTLLESPREFYEALKEDILESEDTTPDTRFRLAQAYYQLGNLSLKISSQEGAAESLQEAAEVLRQLLEAEPENRKHLDQLADVHHALATVYMANPHAGDAASEFDTCRSIRERLLKISPESPDYRVDLAIALRDRSVIHSRQGELDEGMELLDEARKQLEYVLDSVPDNPDALRNLVIVYETMASVHISKSQFQNAVALLEAAMPIADQAMATDTQTHKLRQTQARLQGRISRVHSGMDRSDLAIKHGLLAVEETRELANELPTHNSIQMDLADALQWMAIVESEVGEIGSEGVPELTKN